MSTLGHSPADVLRWLLVSLGVGTDPEAEGAWPIQAANEPDQPDNLMVLYDTSGVLQGREHRSGAMVEFHGVSAQVRGTDHATAWAKMDELRSTLDGSIHNAIVTVGASQYVIHSVTRRSGPLSLGREPGTGRLLFTMNAVVSLRQLS